MGAGNPLLRSYDQELYQAKTYFIDFSELYEDEKEAVREHCCDQYDESEFNSLSESEIEDRFNNLIGHDVDDFKENFFDNYYLPSEGDRCIDELSAESRGYGYVLAETETGIILSTADSENRHFAIGIVPKFKYDDIYDEIISIYGEREEWYNKRNLDFEKAMNNYALSKYKKRLIEFKKENEVVMNLIHASYGSAMSVRCSAWTSGSIKTITYKFKFL